MSPPEKRRPRPSLAVEALRERAHTPERYCFGCGTATAGSWWCDKFCEARGLAIRALLKLTAGSTA
jgi:hypothetical protein